MKARNGATPAELAVLRALHAKGGEASFADLAKTAIPGVEKVLKGMLPARARPMTTGRRTASGKVRGGRAGLVAKEFRDGQVFYRLTSLGLAGAKFSGPWTQKTKSAAVEWTPSRVLVTGPLGEFVGRFSEAGVEIAGVMELKMRPDRTAWRKFRQIVAERYGAKVPNEAVPDFVRLTAAFLAGASAD